MAVVVAVFVVCVGSGAFSVEGCAAVGAVVGVIRVVCSAFSAVNHSYYRLSISRGFAHKIFGIAQND